MYEDKTLVCRDCGNEFIWTAGEQEFYAEKGFQNEPTRCRECRMARKANRPAPGAPREMHDAICANCGKECKVPFVPSGDRPVYCSECFTAMQRNG
ncbi:MAG: zinc-ribbon domain containing protein [Clostridia bacterium]|nr:zinc-ribbon domain containing protein [Clostridia bacterium]